MVKLRASFDVDLLLHESPHVGLINLLISDVARTLFLHEQLACFFVCFFSVLVFIIVGRKKNTSYLIINMTYFHSYYLHSLIEQQIDSNTILCSSESSQFFCFGFYRCNQKKIHIVFDINMTYSNSYYLHSLIKQKIDFQHHLLVVVEHQVPYYGILD